MLKIAICDDDAAYLEKIYTACMGYLDENPQYTAEIRTFNNPTLCLDALEKSGGCDIALLDVRMPGVTGISVAREILSRNPHTHVVFFTSSREYALDAFAVGALHYLLKPFTQEDFRVAMDRVMKNFTVVPACIYIRGEGGTIHKLRVDDIQYIESFRNDRCVHLADGTLVKTRAALRDLLVELQTLSPEQFISPFRSFVVNFTAVSAISPDGIVLKNKTVIPIKQGMFRKVCDSYFNYEFKGGKWAGESR
ncbi:MAG: response regulator transcription factor [Oscillospiraceae bacterium]|nr:response regulator transcription factor [Oscillospiraceae bacterium]